jgi:hypothetical protein
MSIIKDNRIVSDRTFATRLVSFLSNIEVNDAMSQEELEYIGRVADELLKNQISTATDITEIEYLKRTSKL